MTLPAAEPGKVRPVAWTAVWNGVALAINLADRFWGCVADPAGNRSR